MNARNKSERQLTGPRRLLPPRGRYLSCSQVNGTWRPSTTIACCGVFAVIWTDRWGECWAPLHDFDPVSRNQLINECAQLDLEAGYPGAHPWGRSQ